MDAFEPRIRVLLAEWPRMPAPVIADRIGWPYSLSPLKKRLTRIRPDGRVSLQLVGEIYAEGLTPAELAQRLRVAYSKELRDPEVSVIVRTMAARVL